MVHPPRSWSHDNGSPSSASSASAHSQLHHESGTDSTSYTLLHAIDFVAAGQSTDLNQGHHANDWHRSTASYTISGNRPMEEIEFNASSHPAQLSSAPPHGNSLFSAAYFEVGQSEQQHEPQYTQQHGSEWIPASAPLGAIDTSASFYDVEAPSSAPADMLSSRSQAGMFAPPTQISIDDGSDSDRDQDVPADYYRCECGAVLSKLNRSRNQATHKRSSKHRKAMGQSRHKAENLVCQHCERSFARSDSCRRHETTCHRRPGAHGKRRKPYRRKSRSPSPEPESGPSGTSNASLPAHAPITPLNMSHSPSSSAQGSRPATSFASSPRSTFFGRQDGHSETTEPVTSSAVEHQRMVPSYPVQVDSPLRESMASHYTGAQVGGSQDWHRPSLHNYYSAPSSLHSHDTSSSSSAMSSYDASPNGFTHAESSAMWDSAGYHPTDPGVAGIAQPQPVLPVPSTIGTLAPPSRGRAWSVGTQPTGPEYRSPHEGEFTERARYRHFPMGTSVPPVNIPHNTLLPPGIQAYSGAQAHPTAFYPSTSQAVPVRTHNSIAGFGHRPDAGADSSGALAPLHEVELCSDFPHEDRRRR